MSPKPRSPGWRVSLAPHSPPIGTPVAPVDRPAMRSLAVVLVVAALCGFADVPGGGALDAPLPHTPLAPPLDITGGFCEYRIGHFHAGLDLGTGRRVGKPVLAPAAGWIERVRTSGVGYGRSLYLRTADGRLLQFGHLDAFVEPLASFVRARQDSAGQYEQDLWPAPEQFRFRAGETLAWSGESGAGGPHLHFEIRRGDLAYHPLRAGLAARDTTPPTLAAVTLEPLDDTSFVAGRATPFTIRLSAKPDTVQVRGRVRAIVAARDGIWSGVDRMVPWSIALTWQEQRVECRFDSVSWATDMVESGYLYDSGRVIGEKGIVLWAPAGFRPRVLLTSAGTASDAGTIRVGPGDPPRALELEARDLGGNRTRRRVVLTPAPRPIPRGNGNGARGRSPRLELTALPGGWMRITDRGAPAGSGGVSIEVVSLGRRIEATPDPSGWTALVPLGVAKRGTWAEEIVVRGADAAGVPWVLSQLGSATAVSPLDSSRVEIDGRTAVFPAGSVFESSAVLFHVAGLPAATSELSPLAASLTLAPGTLPLRGSVRMDFPLPVPGGGPIGVYREDPDGWEWVVATVDSVRGRVRWETRRLGRFALFRDLMAPRVALAPVPARPGRAAYSRWAVEVRVTEEGSGVDARASTLEIDGRRVPTEWDPEARVLRWRPAQPPIAGTHRVAIAAVDRAGNATRVTESFVLD